MESKTIKNSLVSRGDCTLVIKKLIGILDHIASPQSYSLIAYGGYVAGWRDGLSDLDAILYFENGLLPKTISVDQIHQIQSELAQLYKEIEFLQESNFFADVFILDQFHGKDGRFMVFDSGFIQRLVTINKNYSVMHGNNFLDSLKPMSLRQQEEFQLSLYLHEIRNYLFFEMPRLVSQPGADPKNIYKYFYNLPRFISIILNRPINCIKDALNFLSQRFPNIDYAPLDELCQKNENTETLQEYLKSWQALDNDIIIKCWLCYEYTLVALVDNFPAKSKK